MDRERLTLSIVSLLAVAVTSVFECVRVDSSFFLIALETHARLHAHARRFIGSIS
jgi:hypothetical protein